MSTNEILEEFRQLSLEEKLQLLDAMWGQVAPSDATSALSDEQRQALRQRLSDIVTDDRPVRPVEEVYHEIRNRRRR